MNEWWNELVLSDRRVVYLASEEEARKLMDVPEKLLNPTQLEVVRLLKERQHHRGLGDTVKSALSALGVSPCSGCQERAEKLNEMFPYRRRTE